MSKDWPALLRFLSEELDYDVRQEGTALGYRTFFIDLSGWKLRLTDRTPIIWIQAADLQKATPRHLLQSLQDVQRELGLSRQTTLILAEGDSQPLRKYTARSYLYDLVVLGEEEQARIQKSRRPSGELLDTISGQIPISNLAPYETRAPVTGSRFFGREYEVNRLLSNPDASHMVLGIRRIGKSSLLREVERILKKGEDETPFILYLDCSDLLNTADFIREVVRQLDPRELPRLNMQKYVFYFPDFLERMTRKYKHKIVLLLDEIDNLVLRQRGDWELFRMLHMAVTKQACQVIFAGFREAWKEQNLLESPMYNIARPLMLNEFTRQQAYDLIVTPMENLRVRFKDRNAVVGQIYDETAGHPNLIQYYCSILLRYLDQADVREITPDNLLDVYADQGFKRHLLDSFMYNTENREKALVYAVLRSMGEARRGFAQPFMDAALRRQNIVMPQMNIEEACSVLVLAGIFYQKGDEYFFTSPVFAKVLKETQKLDYLLVKIKEEGL